jgi:phage/plasmid-associated DNA primase
MRLVPFPVTIPRGERDPTLQGKLLAKLAGVLAWIVEGARLYNKRTPFPSPTRSKSRPPATVRTKT